MRRDVTPVVFGSILLVCAVLAAGGVLLTPELEFWAVSDWLFIAALAVTAVLIAAGRSRRPAAMAAAVFAAQVAGSGTVAVRDWFEAAGATYHYLQRPDMATRVSLAAVVALAGTVAVCTAGALLWREPARGWAAWRPLRPKLLWAGVLVAFTIAVLSFLVSSDELTSVGTGLLLVGLPWGGGLAAAAWGGPRVRRAAVRTVSGSAAVVVALTAANMIF